MNDFTKEELKDLHYAIRYFWKQRGILDLPSDDGDFSKSHDLKVKIKSLIDNYCKHEETHDCDYCGIVSCEICKEPCGGELIDE